MPHLAAERAGVFTLRDVGLLGLRLTVGGTLAAHGTQKLFGLWGGAGLDKTAETFERLGFRPGRASAIAAGLGEAGGGILLTVGLGTPAAGAVAAGTMIVAASVHVPAGFFASNKGFEFPAVLAASSAALAMTGPGALSLDQLTSHVLDQTWMRAVGLAAVGPLVALMLARRRRALGLPGSPPAHTRSDPGCQPADTSTPGRPEIRHPGHATGQGRRCHRQGCLRALP
jgi:putative oxidoreductase